MNAFPYTTGHLMVLPIAPSPTSTTSPRRYIELWQACFAMRARAQTAFRPPASTRLNVGAAPAPVFPYHLPLHCVAALGGRTHFMTTIAESSRAARAIGRLWSRLREAWPAR